jgi:hypothetical protein
MARTSRAPAGSKRARWLVQEEQLWCSQQRGRHAEALAHSGRVGADRNVRVHGESGLFETIRNLVGAAGSVEAIEAGEQRQVPSSGQVRIESRCFDEASDSVGNRFGDRIEAAAKQAHGPVVTADEPEEDAHQRCLACAVRTEKSMHTTELRNEVHAAQGIAVPVSLGHIEGFEGESLHR